MIMTRAGGSAGFTSEINDSEIKRKQSLQLDRRLDFIAFISPFNTQLGYSRVEKVTDGHSLSLLVNKKGVSNSM